MLAFFKYPIFLTVLFSLTNAEDKVNVPVVGGTYYLTNTAGALCVTVDAWSKQNNGLVNMWNCLGQDNQKWTLKYAPGDNGGWYQWQNKGSELCLSIGKDLAQGVANNVQILQYECQENFNTFWRLPNGGPRGLYGTYQHLVGNGERCLSWLPLQGGTLYLYDCADYKNQDMRFTHV